MLQGLVDQLPVPYLPKPQSVEPVQTTTSPCEAGQKRMLSSLAKRAIGVFPSVLFSWQAVVVGGQVLCCSAGIVLTVLSGVPVPLLVLAGLGLAIAIADIACLIYHQKHSLPMAHDSIANAVYFMAKHFYDEQKCQDLGSMVSLGSRALLTVAVIGQSLVCSSLGLSLPILCPLSNTAYSALEFMRYGAAGCPVTGQQVSMPFFRLLAQLFPCDESPRTGLLGFRQTPDR
ncbi:pathogenicity island 2 effector protein SseG [Yersinia mollaretii]|uniref:pathogenicity island 2 effector protein SseG n=1 Tax=Yersinia mollaretii TaxID=33060 RepID=UPI0021BDCBE6|nr:pathogenicity island 2 effector protein SseG [Yersinia mollaretii]